MGGDCCGGASKDEAAAAQQQLDDLHVSNAAPQSKPPAANGAAPALSHEDVAKQKLPYYKKRIELFEQYKQRQLQARKDAEAANKPIKVTLPDGGVREGIAGVTSPMDIATGISKSLAKKVLVGKVDGKVWDLMRPLEADCSLELCDWEHPDGKDTFWHSSSHMLGEALESEFGADLTIGPAIEEGFYYDCYIGDRSFGDPEKERLQKRLEKLAKDKLPYERVVVSRDEALGMFQENKFKVEILSGIPQDATITLYRCGPMVDLCRGPHLPNTGYVKAPAISASSRAYWKADVTREGLQRVYGVSYPDKDKLKDYRHRMEEAKKRDHRNVGVKQELFMFRELSPGSAFFLPAGCIIYNALIEYVREKYWEYEYQEVVSPNMYNLDLWVTSGHAGHYKENMFLLDVEKQRFGLKPMNCPGHCLIFGSRTRTYRELPLRMADFGVLHRNEYSGALTGLTRVRRFQQDDAHIFCRPAQVAAEVKGFLKMMGEVYEVFGLSYKMALSTRPEKYMGDLELWTKAEAALEDALNSTGQKWEMNPGDGAFYGPKIDITVYDALRRKFQCATVQLDFQLPLRFGLLYQTEEQKLEPPVIVHRAILGSVERMFAILTEHYAGKWPLWISPRQVMVVPISGATNDYAQQIRKELRKQKLHVEVDVSDRTMQKKVREAQLEQRNYILVVGEQEREAGTVNVRTRDNKVHGMHYLGSVAAKLLAEATSRSLVGAFSHSLAAPAKPATADGAPAAAKAEAAAAATNSAAGQKPHPVQQPAAEQPAA